MVETCHGSSIVRGGRCGDDSTDSFHSVGQPRVLAAPEVSPLDVRHSVSTKPGSGFFEPFFSFDPRQAGKRPNVILISIDTVRRDHLTVYWYPRPTSPNLSELARDSVVFDAAVAPEPWTLPSHMSMMTSLHPLVHGVLSRNARLNRDRNTLAEVLSEAGYFNAAFVASSPDGWVGGLRGFADGFHRYDHPPHERRRTLGTSLLRILERLAGPISPGSAEDIRRTATEFLAERRSGPFFVFLHLYDVHSDFDKLPDEAPADRLKLFPSARSGFNGCDETGLCASNFLSVRGRDDVTTEMLSDIVAHYDANLRYLDDELGEFFRTLRSLGYYDESLIIVTADHGEEFLEHGRFLHYQTYREVLEIPLIIKFPHQRDAGTRVPYPASSVDLMPTVLDVAELEYSGLMQGESLTPRLRLHGEPGREIFFSNTQQGGDFSTTHIGIQAAGKKLIVPMQKRPSDEDVGAMSELYDLESDAQEMNNLARSEIPAESMAINDDTPEATQVSGLPAMTMGMTCSGRVWVLVI